MNLNRIALLLKKMISKELSISGQIIGVSIVKLLYVIATYIALHNQLYTLKVSYDVGFVFWKELCAFGLFIGEVYLIFKLPFISKFLSNLVFLLVIISYVPINSAFSLNDTTISFFLLTNLYFLCLCLAIFYGEKFANFIKKKCIYKENLSGRKCKILSVNSRLSDNESDFYLRCFCVVICIFLVIHKLNYNGFQFPFTVQPDEVYAGRAAYRAYTLRISGTPMAYFLTIVKNLSTVIIPFYILRSMIYKKVFGVICGLLATCSLYAISYEKSNLFSLIIVVGVYIGYRLQLFSAFKKIIIYGFVLCLSVCLISMLLSSDGESTIYRLLIRREMYLPAWLNTLYYDFFNVHPKLNWHQDAFLLEKIFVSVYDKSVLELINNAYFYGEIPSPNTGLFAEAYMHFGRLGIVVYPLLLSIVINGMNIIYCMFNKTICILLAALLSLSILNIPILMTEMILSHILFACIAGVLMMIRKPNRDNCINKLL